MSTGLDPRLRAVADAVRQGSVVADIGTDHGYLVRALVESGKCPRAYASDINTGPLAAAERHLRAAGPDVSGQVRLVLSDGLANVPVEDVDDIVIAGMGGELIGEILGGVDWSENPGKRYILQPMTKAEELRRFLCKKGFSLVAERAVLSGRFVYTVMTAVYTGERCEKDELFAWTGLLWDNEEPAAWEYLVRVAARLEKRAAGLEAASCPDGKASRLREMIGRMNANLLSRERSV